MRKCYGYKICYQEQGSNVYVRHFITYTYKQAISARNGYMHFPPTAREDNHKLNHPTWKIIPINRDEVKAGILDEDPF